MKTFLILYIVLVSMSLLARLALLSFNSGYPRTTKHTRFEDVLAVVLGSGALGWAVWLLVNYHG
ncbi:hypothetical protein OpiT1DRAFT_05687 [Opitutaceae bacterium TAV1]|nr:hypothetical protein OpiT1DRAFT_05687 [Opitutaceae bacterium TAV1]